MGQITLVLTDEAETILRSKNNKRGDMGNYVSTLITSCAQTVKEEKK